MRLAPSMDDKTLGEAGLGEPGQRDAGRGAPAGEGAAQGARARESAAQGATAGDGGALGDDALEAVAALVQEGLVPRLWIFLIEPDGSLRRGLQHVDGIPVSPDAYAVLALRGILGHLLETDQEAVFVIERPAGPAPTPDDWAWHDAIVRAARGIPVPLRGVLLAHRDGVDAMRPRTLAA
jgi:hypothetical protein